MLYYLGYLTIVGEEFETPELKVPNRVMKEIYSDYFIRILNKNANMQMTSSIYTEITREIALEGKFEEIKAIPNLSMYTVIAVNDKIYVEKINE